VRFFIPSHLAYGSTGFRIIPPNADLVFDMEIVSIAE
jgi:FKBP-type peptidyl-prolyl cis-trans isomerase